MATEPQLLSVGNSRLTFKGRWAPLLHGGKQIGLFMEGQGSLQYISRYEPEKLVFPRNIGEWTSIKPVKSPDAQTATIPFANARVYFAGLSDPKWAPGDSAASLDRIYQLFDQRWAKVDGHFPFHLMDVQATNAPGKVAVVVEFEQGNDCWKYEYDGVERTVETLSFVKPFPSLAGPNFKGWHYVVPLSHQPIGWDPKKSLAPSHFQVSALDVDLRTHDNRNVEVVVQETITPLEDGLQTFTFNFWTSVDTEKEKRTLTITRITDAEGRSLGYSHSHDKLALRLQTPARRGVPFTLRFEYKGDFLIQPREDNYWQLGVRGAWYPTPESLASEFYTFHGVVRTKGDWIAFLPGETVRREKDGEWNVVETRTSKPISFATILGGKYFLDEETHDGLTVRIATYAFKPGDANKIFKAQAFNVIKYYETFLGPFPFKEFLIIQKNEWGYGQAPPGMMYITREAFEQLLNARQWQDLSNMLEQAKRSGAIISGALPSATMDVRHVFAHEIAHQYWGTVVKMPSPQEQWITESFAEYCAALFERDYKGKGLFDKNVSKWDEKAQRVAKMAPIPLANESVEKEGMDRFYTRTNLLYAKGPMLLLALHRELGEQAFLTWLKSIQTNFRWKFATTRKLFDLLGFMTKKDYTPFYEEFFWGYLLPPIKP